MCGDCLYEISRENSDCVISTTVRGLNDGMLRSGSAPVSREETKRWGRRGAKGGGELVGVATTMSELRVVCVID